MSLSTISLVLVVAIVVSLIKPFLELKVQPANPLHDTAIRLLAILVGIVGAGLDYAARGGDWGNGRAIEALFGNGLTAGVGAVVTYHLLTSSVWDTLAPSAAVAAAKLDDQPAVVTTTTLTMPAAPPSTSVPPPAPANPLPADFVPFTPPSTANT